MRAFARFAAALPLLVLGQATASAATHDAPQLISAFRTICLEHLGDAAAQVAEGSRAPWNFVADQPAESGEDLYRSEFGLLAIGGAVQSCTITAEMDADVDLAAFRAAMAASLSLDDGRPLPEPDSAYWLIATDPSNEQFVIALKVSAATGRNLATLTIQKREAR